jgi:hypothetical protein
MVQMGKGLTQDGVQALPQSFHTWLDGQSAKTPANNAKNMTIRAAMRIPWGLQKVKVVVVLMQSNTYDLLNNGEALTRKNMKFQSIGLVRVHA